MNTGSLSQYAAHIGVSPAYVTKLKAQGRLVMFKQPDGREVVNFDMTDRMVKNTTDQSRARNGANAKPGRDGADDSAGVASGAAFSDVGGGAGRVDALFRKAQTQQKVFEAKRAELEYQRAVGQLIDKTSTERAVFDAFRSLRDHAFAAPQRAAPRIIGLTESREVEAILAEELRRAFDGWEAKMAERLTVGAHA